MNLIFMLIKGTSLEKLANTINKALLRQHIKFSHDFNLLILKNNVSEVKTSLAMHHLHINLW